MVGERPDNGPAPPSGGPWPTIPGYEVLGELGRGSMGIVYQARQLNLHRLVALKMMRTGAHLDAEAQGRFIEEARLIASLQHPNIVQIYEINLREDAPFFSMELVEGGTLADRLGGRPQPFRQAAQLVQTLARAIDLAHQMGIVHRDLKPANILLATTESRHSRLQNLSREFQGPNLDAQPWVPKISDFGLAKQFGVDSGRTESGMVLGTPSYMAPEQAEGKSREVGPPADVYGLGAILYELLTGRPPYAGESPLETVLQLFQIEPVPPSRLQPKVPRDLETICLKCLQKEPKRRYQTAQDLAQDLQHFLAGEPITARPASVFERVGQWAKRRPALATLAASAGVALIGLAGLALWHQADLQFRLTQARLDERQARDAQEDASKSANLMAQRDKIKDLLREGEGALERKDWPGAREQLRRARDQVADEPEFTELREHIDQLLVQAELHRLDRERLEQFQLRRNEALFQAMRFTGGDLVSSLDETRKAARDALALFDAAPDSERTLTVESPHFEEQEKADIRTGCYELLLVLAEAVAQPLPGQAPRDQQHQGTEALRILDRAAELGLCTRAYHLRRAQYLAQSGEAAAAQQERQRAETIPPTTELDRFLLGTEEYREGNWKQAIAAFETVLQSQPEHFWAHCYLALCWLKAHQPELAVARLTACLGWRPNLPWLHLLRGSAWAEMSQFAHAEEDFAAALQVSLPESARYGLYINRGVSFIRQGRLVEAGEDLRRATALRPGQYQGYVNLAQAYLQDQKLDEAVGQLDQAVEHQPHLASLYRTRARVHLLRQEDSAALADLDRAINLEAGRASPDLAEDHLERGRILHRRKEYDAALGAYDAAVAVQPHYPRAQRLRAEALLERSRLPEALEALDACLQHGAADADAFRARAAVRTRLGQYPGAQTDYTRALELEPDAATFAARGWTFLVAEAPSLALPDFQAALRLDPELGEAYSGRGYARVLLGQYRPAVADAEEALRHGSISPRLLYNAARIYAQAALGLAGDVRRDNRTTAPLLSSWQERACGLLRQALDLQSPSEGARFWRAYLQNDAAFNPIRRSSSFRHLEDRYTRVSQ
jgi:tetratricopeptide (TPR) repeat protein